MWKWVAIALVLVAVVAGVVLIYYGFPPTQGYPAQMIFCDEDYLESHANHIVDGIVTNSSEPCLYLPYGVVVTCASLMVNNSLKGSLAIGDEIEIREIPRGPGDEAVFHQGDIVRVYLQTTELGYRPVCGFQGVRRI